MNRGDERAPRNAPRDENRGEPRAERGERSERGDGRRGPRPEREPRRPAPVAEGAAAEAAVSAEAFVDTLPAADTTDAGEAQGERQGGRRRNRRGGRGGRDRDEAGAVPADNDQRVAAAAHGQEPIAAEAVSADDGDVAPIAARSDGGEAGEAGEGRRRGRGRDRSRRERSPEGAAENETATTDGVIQGGALASEAFHDAETPPAAPTPLATAPVAAEPPAIEEPAVVSAAYVAPVAAPAPVAPAVAAPPSVAAPVPAFVLPIDSLQSVAESAGLQWVNSDVEKIRAVQAAMASEPAPVHVPRERKPAPVIDEGPLVLVETRKDLSQIKLPFETAQGGSQATV